MSTPVPLEDDCLDTTNAKEWTDLMELIRLYSRIRNIHRSVNEYTRKKEVSDKQIGKMINLLAEIKNLASQLTDDTFKYICKHAEGELENNNDMIQDYDAQLMVLEGQLCSYMQISREIQQKLSSCSEFLDQGAVPRPSPSEWTQFSKDIIREQIRFTGMCKQCQDVTKRARRGVKQESQQKIHDNECQCACCSCTCATVHTLRGPEFMAQVSSFLHHLNSSHDHQRINTRPTLPLVFAPASYAQHSPKEASSDEALEVDKSVNGHLEFNAVVIDCDVDLSHFNCECLQHNDIMTPAAAHMHKIRSSMSSLSTHPGIIINFLPHLLGRTVNGGLPYDVVLGLFSDPLHQSVSVAPSLAYREQQLSSPTLQPVGGFSIDPAYLSMNPDGQSLRQLSSSSTGKERRSSISTTLSMQATGSLRSLSKAFSNLSDGVKKKKEEFSAKKLERQKKKESEVKNKKRVSLILLTTGGISQETPVSTTDVDDGSELVDYALNPVKHQRNKTATLLDVKKILAKPSIEEVEEESNDIELTPVDAGDVNIDIEDAPPGNWKCHSCKFPLNPDDLDICAGCEEKRQVVLKSKDKSNAAKDTPSKSNTIVTGDSVNTKGHEDVDLKTESEQSKESSNQLHVDVGRIVPVASVLTPVDIPPASPSLLPPLPTLSFQCLQDNIITVYSTLESGFRVFPLGSCDKEIRSVYLECINKVRLDYRKLNPDRSILYQYFLIKHLAQHNNNNSPDDDRDLRIVLPHGVILNVLSYLDPFHFAWFSREIKIVKVIETAEELRRSQKAKSMVVTSTTDKVEETPAKYDVFNSSYY